MTEKRLRILHLEDNKNDATIVESTLINGGITAKIVWVESRADFTVAIEDGKMDLIIADYSLPSFDGLSALAMARERCPKIPFIFVSGVMGEETAIETLKLGATDYVLKGRLARLVPAVHRAMREVREEELAVENKKARGLLDKEVLILTKAMDATTDGIFLIEAMKPDFPLTYVNSTYQKIIGHDKKDILGKNYFSLTSLHFDQHIVEEIKSTLLQGKSFHDELLSFKKDDVQHCYSLRITPVHDGSGAITNYIGIKTDVTLIRDKNLEIKEQRENLLHVTRVGKLAEFVSSLAHEISQPLTAILSYAQAAQRLLGDREPQIKQIFQHIATNSG